MPSTGMGKMSRSKKSHDSSSNQSRSREDIIEQRRLRNIESAKRSRARLNNEQKWVQIQMKENDDRMRTLETQVSLLTKELAVPSRKSKKESKGMDEDRPAWFGEAF